MLLRILRIPRITGQLYDVQTEGSLVSRYLFTNISIDAPVPVRKVTFIFELNVPLRITVRRL